MKFDRKFRFQEFLHRLSAAPPVASQEEALVLIHRVLSQVEDEMTDIPFDPAHWESDGRHYPPMSDQKRAVPGRCDLCRYRSRGHNTLIANNGAIAIYEISGRGVFEKPGADGLGVDWMPGI